MRATKQKQDKLFNLAQRRQLDRIPGHLTLADFHDGYYECDHVSPWSISACNVDAELMLMAQDWASSNVLNQQPDIERKTLGQDWWSPTNTNVRQFLKFMDLNFSQTYATNVFPFIKRGPKSADIPLSDVVYGAMTYGLPQIKIVSPRMVICLGRKTFNAICLAADLPIIDWSEASSPTAHTVIWDVEIYGLPHPSPLGINNAGGRDVVCEMWEVLSDHFRRIR